MLHNPLHFDRYEKLGTTTPRDYYIQIPGVSEGQNDKLTRSADHRDIWLHTQKIHGSHVILWTEGQAPDLQSLNEAACLAAWFSQGREGKKVPVDYTPVKYVKKPAGARPGMVIYTTYQTAYVDPDPTLAERLKA